jgi:hypothetical protein
MKFGSEVVATVEEMCLAVAEETLLSDYCLVVIHHFLLFHQVEGLLSYILITFSS